MEAVLRFVPVDSDSGIETARRRIVDLLRSYFDEAPRSPRIQFAETTPSVRLTSIGMGQIEVDRWEKLRIEVISKLARGTDELVLVCDVNGFWNRGGDRPPRSFPYAIESASARSYATRICDFLQEELPE